MPRTDPFRRPWVALPLGPVAIAPERLETRSSAGLIVIMPADWFQAAEHAYDDETRIRRRVEHAPARSDRWVW